MIDLLYAAVESAIETDFSFRTPTVNFYLLVYSLEDRFRGLLDTTVSSAVNACPYQKLCLQRNLRSRENRNRIMGASETGGDLNHERPTTDRDRKPPVA